MSAFTPNHGLVPTPYRVRIISATTVAFEYHEDELCRVTVAGPLSLNVGVTTNQAMSLQYEWAVTHLEYLFD